MSRPVVTREQVEVALELVIKHGMDTAEAAVKLGVSKPAMLRWLQRESEYQKHREQQKRQLEAKKTLVLDLARQGFCPAVIARETGTSETTVNVWMKQVGIDTSLMGTDDLTCPACSGTMKRQDLYFWQCSCGAEWWPEEAPEDPDDWTRPWRLRAENGDNIVKLMKRLHNECKNAIQIAQSLNEAGYLTPRGKPWERANVLSHMKRHGIMADDYQKIRDRVIEIVKSMAGKVYNCKDMADRLNMEGFKTSRGQSWTLSSVRHLIRNSLKLDVVLPYNKGIPRIKAGVKSTREHPWSRDEHARVEAVKARYPRK